MRMLLVDDDTRFAEVLIVALGKIGYQLDHVERAGDAVAVSAYDAVLLDLNLPDLDGLDVCRRIRQHSNVPIIILTARGALGDKVIGLRRGADDYLIKPFSVMELQARLEAVLRRGRPLLPAAQTLGDLTLDPDRHRATVDGCEIELTRKEFHLLGVLAEAPGSVLRKNQLMVRVWQAADPSAARTLEVHISSLRTKLRRAVTIETVRGVGYRLVPRGDGNAG
ncbi:putative transcriptional regulator ycf27 [Actinoplanes sp. SE50]|uniref:response regulator transcription factor n=1 Tax=unclassified Actinoplanes TaxID=2626549 RepID=UPI00023EBDEC|nr:MULTISPECIES: response regulator transcription factor [unclassified Actinoplanes]AEV86906.1 putative transcriptional regulator ycf27 [Actinoplanes sp. SE50/110]ATO85303.1 putative transcriptional regulator ycf27 [Actinoplanes sp. SE50]SLM02713.1 putative two-component system response regulator [Actinoplanes sp. SE50/110]